METAKYVELNKKAEEEIVNLRQKNGELASKCTQVENHLQEMINKKTA